MPLCATGAAPDAGMFVDVSQQESAVSLIGGEVLAYQISGQEPERIGNHSPYVAPHNAYPCAGEDRWVTIAATNDGEWQQLAEAIGRPELAADALYATNADRRNNQRELDRIIGRMDRKPGYVGHNPPAPGTRNTYRPSAAGAGSAGRSPLHRPGHF